MDYMMLKTEFKYNLAICTYFRNNACYLKEWIEFHRIVGVEKFFLYNDNSSDNYLEVLEPYIKKGIVELKDWPPKSEKAPYTPGTGDGIHMDCISKQKYNVKWIAFLNIDEFLFSSKADDLKKVIVEYEEYPAIGVNWLLFGSSGHIEKQKLQTKAYTKRAVTDYFLNMHIKSIVNPRKTLSRITDHAFTYTDGYCVNENKKRVGVKIPNFYTNEGYMHESISQNFSYPISVSKLRINHYRARSRSEFLFRVRQKRAVNRPLGDINEYLYYVKGVRTPSVYDVDAYLASIDKNNVRDTAILKFSSKLKARLNERV